MVSAPGGHTWTRMTQGTLGGVPPFLAIHLFFWRASHAVPHAFFIRLHGSPCNAQGHEKSPLGLWGQQLLFMCKIWLGNCNLNLGHWNWIRITSQTATTSAQVYLTHAFFCFSLGVLRQGLTWLGWFHTGHETEGGTNPGPLVPTSYPLGLFYRRLLGLISLTFFFCCSSDEVFS